MCAVCFTRRSTLLALAGGFATIAVAGAQQLSRRSATSVGPVLISNVRIFDGISDHLKPGNVLVVDRKIKQISAGPITPPPGSTSIDGGGRVLIPGLTDAHWHMVFAPNTIEEMNGAGIVNFAVSGWTGVAGPC
jgi:adenine deaminase